MSAVPQEPVPERLQQPEGLRQSAQQIFAQRAAWGRDGGEAGHGNYLVVEGVRRPTPFATRAFDQHPALRLEAPLPAAAWSRQLWGHLAGTLRQTLTAPGALWADRRQVGRRLLQKERWQALYNQGHFSLCAQPRVATAESPRASVRAVVLHWDQCNSSAQCFDVLRKRGLSAHLLVDEDGLVFQLLDLASMVAFHAGRLNASSVGIEINNPVDPRLQTTTAQARSLVHEPVAHTQEQGWRLAFTPAQNEVLPKLLDFLCANFPIATELPASIDAAGYEPSPMQVAADFSGVCGHYHVGEHKADPGLSLWPLLRAHWRV